MTIAIKIFRKRNFIISKIFAYKLLREADNEERKQDVEEIFNHLRSLRQASFQGAGLGKVLLAALSDDRVGRGETGRAPQYTDKKVGYYKISK